MQTKENHSRGKKLIYDAILVLALFVVGLSALLAFKSCAKEGTSVTVAVGGEEIASYSLNINARYELGGGTNVLVIDGGEAFMESATCPRQMCVNFGRISRIGEAIICNHYDVVVTVR